MGSKSINDVINSILILQSTTEISFAPVRNDRTTQCNPSVPNQVADEKPVKPRHIFFLGGGEHWRSYVVGYASSAYS